MNWSAEPLYVFWCNHVVAQWASRQVAPEPEPEPSEWEVQKQMNRLRRMTEKIENRQWIPKLQYRLNGKAVKELQEAYTLLGTSVEGVTQVDALEAGKGKR
jgi:hypothetical protein